MVRPQCPAVPGRDWRRSEALGRRYLCFLLFPPHPLPAQMCAEWWSFEITQILAGLMGEVNLATQLITLQLVSVAFTIGNGIGVGKRLRFHGHCRPDDVATTAALKCHNVIMHDDESLGRRLPSPMSRALFSPSSQRRLCALDSSLEAISPKLRSGPLLSALASTA
jgi:hypothetical protein